TDSWAERRAAVTALRGYYTACRTGVGASALVHALELALRPANGVLRRHPLHRLRVHGGDDFLGLAERGLGAGRPRVAEGAGAAGRGFEGAHRLVHLRPHLAAFPERVGPRGVAAFELEPARVLLLGVEPLDELLGRCHVLWLLHDG